MPQDNKMEIINDWMDFLLKLIKESEEHPGRSPFSKLLNPNTKQNTPDTSDPNENKSPTDPSPKPEANEKKSATDSSPSAEVDESFDLAPNPDGYDDDAQAEHDAEKMNDPDYDPNNLGDGVDPDAPVPTSSTPAPSPGGGKAPVTQMSSMSNTKTLDDASNGISNDPAYDAQNKAPASTPAATPASGPDASMPTAMPGG